MITIAHNGLITQQIINLAYCVWQQQTQVIMYPPACVTNMVSEGQKIYSSRDGWTNALPLLFVLDNLWSNWKVII